MIPPQPKDFWRRITDRTFIGPDDQQAALQFHGKLQGVSLPILPATEAGRREAFRLVEITDGQPL
jgi:hypothetical protein